MAVIQLTEALVGELSPHQIRINAIAPGWFHTPMTDKYNPKMMAANNPLGFVGVPRDLDGVLLLLASNQASRYITGITITIDGGVSWGVILILFALHDTFFEIGIYWKQTGKHWPSRHLEAELSLPCNLQGQTPFTFTDLPRPPAMLLFRRQLVIEISCYIKLRCLSS